MAADGLSDIHDMTMLVKPWCSLVCMYEEGHEGVS